MGVQMMVPLSYTILLLVDKRHTDRVWSRSYQPGSETAEELDVEMRKPRQSVAVTLPSALPPLAPCLHPQTGQFVGRG